MPHTGAFQQSWASVSVLNKHNAQQRTEQYSEAGEVTIDVEIAVSSLEEMKQDMLDATHGVVKPELLQ